MYSDEYTYQKNKWLTLTKTDGHKVCIPVLQNIILEEQASQNGPVTAIKYLNSNYGAYIVKESIKEILDSICEN